MKHVLLTGATGTLGRRVVRTLTDQGIHVRMLTRTPRAEAMSGVSICAADLTDRCSLRQALRNEQYVIHAASHPRDAQRVDLEGTRNLLHALGQEQVVHFIYVSIAGVDRSEYPYYQIKHEVEKMVAVSGMPWTVLRATQFHDLVLNRMIKPFDAGAGSPLRVPRGMRFQSVDAGDVAIRLQQLISGGPTRTTITMGGPEVRTIEEMTERYLEACGRKDPVQPEAINGELYDLFRSGINVGSAWERGRTTWEEFLRSC